MILKSEDEIQFIKELVWSIRDVAGNLAEAGVFEGDSAEIIREKANGKKLFLFDTFEGFIEKQILNGEPYKKGDLSVSYQQVQEKFKNNDKVRIFRGDVVETKDYISNENFAFIHLDLDIYQPTKACLDFFYPRLSVGGILLIDDYCPTNWGIIKAVNEFIVEHNLELKRGVSRLAYIKK